MYTGRIRSSGLTLLEVSLAVVVMATALMGIFHLFVSNERMLIISREESLALYGAEEMINEIRSMPFSSTSGGTIVANYDKTTRSIQMAGAEVPDMRLGVASAPPGASAGDGLKVANEMGVIIVNQESPNETAFGDTDGDGDRDFPVDLDLNGSFTNTLNQAYWDIAVQAPPTGRGIRLTFPTDLGGSTLSKTETIAPSLLRLVPVAVVVRWNSLARLERRIQILTFITDRAGNY